MRRDILTKRAEQIVEKRHGKMTGADSRAQREKHTVVTNAVRHARVQPILPIIQQPQPFRVGPLALVGEVVRCSRERVQRSDVGPHARRHQPRRDRKVLVVRTRKPFAFGVCDPEIGGVDMRGSRRYRQDGHCTGDRRCATR